MLIHSCGGELAIDHSKKVRIEPAADSMEGSDIVSAVLCEKCGEHLGALANVDDKRGIPKRVC